MPSRLEDLALVRVVEVGQHDALALDVAPDVELGPVGQREHAHVLAGRVAAVVEVPELGALAARVPGAERVAQAEDPLLGAGLLLVAPAAAEHGVELVGLDGVEQRDGLQRVAGAVGALAQRGRRRCSPARWRRPAAARAGRPSRRGTRAPRGSCGRCRRAAARTAAAPGANALSARCSMTTESLPPLNSSTGRSNSPATSRKMWIASASRWSRWSSDSGMWDATGRSTRAVMCAARIRSWHGPTSGPREGPRRRRRRGCTARSRSRRSRSAAAGFEDPVLLACSARRPPRSRRPVG